MEFFGRPTNPMLFKRTGHAHCCTDIGVLGKRWVLHRSRKERYASEPRPL